jgi:hypothetical protein
MFSKSVSLSEADWDLLEAADNLDEIISRYNGLFNEESVFKSIYPQLKEYPRIVQSFINHNELHPHLRSLALIRNINPLVTKQLKLHKFHVLDDFKENSWIPDRETLRMSLQDRSGYSVELFTNDLLDVCGRRGQSNDFEFNMLLSDFFDIISDKVETDHLFHSEYERTMQILLRGLPPGKIKIIARRDMIRVLSSQVEKKRASRSFLIADVATLEEDESLLLLALLSSDEFRPSFYELDRLVWQRARLVGTRWKSYVRIPRVRNFIIERQPELLKNPSFKKIEKDYVQLPIAAIIEALSDMSDSNFPENRNFAGKNELPL